MEELMQTQKRSRAFTSSVLSLYLEIKTVRCSCIQQGRPCVSCRSENSQNTGVSPNNVKMTGKQLHVAERREDNASDACKVGNDGMGDKGQGHGA